MVIHVVQIRKHHLGYKNIYAFGQNYDLLSYFLFYMQGMYFKF